MLRWLPAALLLVLSVVPSSSCWSLLPTGWGEGWGWGTSRGARRFTDENLIDAGSLELPTDAAAGTVAAWLDWDGDQHLDLVLLAADQRSFAIHTWDRAHFRFRSTAAASSDFVITNVVPGDFDFDGRIDLLVMGGKNPGGGGGGGWWGGGAEQDDTTEMRIHLQQPNGTLGEPIMVDPATLAQPIPFDGDGDMRTDLLGFSHADPNRLQMWQNSFPPGGGGENGTAVFTLTDAPLDYSTHPSGKFTCRFPSPHFNAFVDLDGDCLADLFLVCFGGDSEGKHRDDPDQLEYQVWTNSKKRSSGGGGGPQFVFKREGKLPRGTKGISFGDMDRDGTIDLVVTSCPKPNRQRGCEISILYNYQIPLCDSVASPSSSEPCRDPEALCTADPEFAFTAYQDATRFQVETVTGGRRLVSRVSSTRFKGSYPLPPQVGDFNIDGYPDLLLVTSDPQRGNNDGGDRRAQILESVPCSLSSSTAGAVGCSEEDVRNGGRGFRLVTTGAEALDQIRDVESASWVDLDDDGTLDLLVQRSVHSASGAARNPVFIKNNYFHDAFFLKLQ
ncbi:hypothetical protein JCM3774_004150, partial [Rhodotorula dairenensis]